ncbi:MAG: protein kinase [Gemmatimonadetes bacterium]|nr:protein kinase [Gemmatimonadota bacterium]
MATRWFSLTTRIFTSTAAVVAAVLGVTLYFTSREAARTADTTVDRALSQATDQISTQLDSRRRALQGTAEIFVKDPNYRALVQSKTQLADLLDQTVEAQQRIGADWVQVTDADGMLLAKSDEPGAPQDTLGGSLIGGALSGEATAGYGASPEGGLLQTIAVPVTVPSGATETVVGALMAVRSVDATFARSVMGASPDSINVAFFVIDEDGPRVVASTIGTGPEITTTIAEIHWPSEDDTVEAPQMRVRTRMAGIEYVALGAPLRTASGSLVGGLVVFRNRDVEFAAFRRLERTIILWGGLGLAFAGLLALGIARQITKPVLQLVSATRRAADGDYSADINVKASGEVGTLADSFRAMLADLREKQALVEFLSAGSAEAKTVAVNAASAPTLAMNVHAGGIVPGSTFALRYEVKEMLGVGGMGMVFRAVDTELGELIAIKTLKEDVLGEDSSALERFKSEIRLARKISHRNVVRTHDFGESGGVYFITMEYVEGRSLKDLITSRGKLPVPVTLSVAKQLCRALEIAHDEGVIHRDIKPQNMVVQADGVLKVMDFGIARLAKRKSGVTQQGMVVGTPEYMAPEQLLGDEIDARADIYAVGCVLYECLTGKTPITADTPITLIAKVLEDVPLDPRVVNADVSAALSAIVLSCLAKTAAERPASALKLHDMLAAIG